MKPSQIKALRKKLGFTMQDLAKAIGVTAESVSHWEHGRFKPSTCWIVKMQALIK